MLDEGVLISTERNFFQDLKLSQSFAGEGVVTTSHEEMKGIKEQEKRLIHPMMRTPTAW